MPDDLLVFCARLPERELSFDLRAPTITQAGEAAFAALEACRQIAFDYSPINLSSIRALSDGASISPSQLASETGKTPASKLEEKLAGMVEAPQPQAAVDPMAKAPKGSPVEIAFSAYLGGVFDRAFPPEKLQWQKAGAERREVRLVANFAGWQAVKKVELAAAEKKEVVAACASIFERSKAKLPSLLLGAKAPEYESLADAFLSNYPERKSFARLPEILFAAQAEAPKLSALAGGDARLDSRLKKLFYYSCFARAGFTPYVNTDTVSRIWPELKTPKPRGNFGGKKKRP